MPFGSLFRASQWPQLEQSLTTYYNPPPHPSQNLPPDPPKHPCRKPHRRYFTRGWNSKLYDPIITHHAGTFLDLHLTEGDAAIDAFRDYCQPANGYGKKDDMGYLERAAVDAKAVRDWKDFERNWAQAEEERWAEEEKRRQQQKRNLNYLQQNPPKQQHYQRAISMPPQHQHQPKRKQLTQQQPTQQHQQQSPRIQEQMDAHIVRDLGKGATGPASRQTKPQAQQSTAGTTN